MTSRVSGKGQITLPKGIREKLGVRAGDALVCEMEGKTLRIRKAEPLDLGRHEAISHTAAEWDSAYVHENFDDL